MMILCQHISALNYACVWKGFSNFVQFNLVFFKFKSTRFWNDAFFRNSGKLYMKLIKAMVEYICDSFYWSHFIIVITCLICRIWMLSGALRCLLNILLGYTWCWMALLLLCDLLWCLVRLPDVNYAVNFLDPWLCMWFLYCEWVYNAGSFLLGVSFCLCNHLLNS